jgi:hypothetical protein
MSNVRRRRPISWPRGPAFAGPLAVTPGGRKPARTLSHRSRHVLPR